MLYVKNHREGGATIKILNPPGGTCPPITGGCSGGFYDDRAYMTLNGTTVDSGNTVGNALCGGTPPATTFSNTLTGYDTAGTQGAYGAGAGGTTNPPRPGSLGDAKGLDTWADYPSNTALAPL